MVDNVRLQVSNEVETELAEDINDTETTFDVDDGSVLPDTPHRLTITDGDNNEIIEVTDVSTNTITCERGKEDTSGQSWSAGDLVENRWTAGTYEELAGQDQDVDFDSIMPTNSDVSNIGTEAEPFGDIWGTVHYEDIVFAEKTCEVCGEPLEKGDGVNLMVVDAKDDGTYMRPKHEGC